MLMSDPIQLNLNSRRVLCCEWQFANMLDSTWKSASCKLQASIPDGIASFRVIPYNLFDCKSLRHWQVGSLQRQVAFFPI